VLSSIHTLPFFWGISSLFGWVQTCCNQIFEMMDAKARQDCIKEIDLLRVRHNSYPLNLLSGRHASGVA
jgi:hypothetical protein